MKTTFTILIGLFQTIAISQKANVRFQFVDPQPTNNSSISGIKISQYGAPGLAKVKRDSIYFEADLIQNVETVVVYDWSDINNSYKASYSFTPLCGTLISITLNAPPPAGRSRRRVD
jgi:hypothetical protein